MLAEARDGAWLAYDVHGEGEPLLLIMGLSGSRRAWYRLRPWLVPRCRTIALDNRGTGDSDRVTGPLTMDDLVTDAVAVLDAAGVDRAHVLGVSMGGMVAQHLALDHRDRVRSLVLGCTTAGGRRGSPPWRLLSATALRPVVGITRTFPLVVPALYARTTREQHPRRVEEDLRIRLADATDVRTTLAQMTAVARHDTRARLGELAGLDVTVIHGAEDALVPPYAGRALAAAIPGARLVMIPACGHMLTTDAEEVAARAVLAHLERASSRSPAAA
ncbi:MAG TPA: alpha/beta fold hydrolase [Solirubrobacteraceae bacterium]|jgi:pimeloyl-ACP methyl ester carboxylesterase